jgi:hypothetical protein
MVLMYDLMEPLRLREGSNFKVYAIACSGNVADTETGALSAPRLSCNPVRLPYSALTTSLGWVTLMLTMVSPSATSS